jgi:hypothetical protein
MAVTWASRLAHAFVMNLRSLSMSSKQAAADELKAQVSQKGIPSVNCLLYQSPRSSAGGATDKETYKSLSVQKPIDYGGLHLVQKGVTGSIPITPTTHTL